MRLLLNTIFFLFLGLIGLGARPAEAGGWSPIILKVLESPVPVKGSDGAFHLVYELELTNASSKSWTVEKITILNDLNKAKKISVWQGEKLKKRMGALGTRRATTVLDPSQSAILWVALKFSRKNTIPTRLSHQLNLSSDGSRIELTGGSTAVSQEIPVTIAPPLRGEGWVVGDGCCNSTLHLRAMLPVDGGIFTSQRFAIDWEKLGPNSKLFEGEAKQLKSYFAYQQKIYAVADGRVVHALDGLPNQVPGNFPSDIKLHEADGNHVVQEIAPGRYALYAHMDPGSLKVKTGQRVKVGQVLGLVGNSGNTIAPHLHFHVTNGPSTFASEGIPYQIKAFDLVGRTPGTDAFNQAESKGVTLPVLPVKHPGSHLDELPLDQRVVNFPLRP